MSRKRIFLALFVTSIGLAAIVFAIEPASLNIVLPNNVQPEDGKITLVVDYTNKHPDRTVPVYLINASGEDIKLTSQDGDVYLKLEYQDKDGKWKRAQPHGYSWCGNSYDNPPTIKSGHFFNIKGYQPMAGEKQAIRYSLYGQKIKVSSNIGEGLVSETDILWASQDSMAVYEGSFDFVSQVALSEKTLINKMDHVRDLQGAAILTLASKKFDPQKSREVLKRVQEKFPERKSDVDTALTIMERHLLQSKPYTE